ncbi:MAG: hypothetical protein ACE5IR_11675 [bacterium]
MNTDKIIYAINIEDVQTVAAEQLDWELTENELNFVEDRLGDYINWYDSINFALFD